VHPEDALSDENFGQSGERLHQSVHRELARQTVPMIVITKEMKVEKVSLSGVGMHKARHSQCFGLHDMPTSAPQQLALPIIGCRRAIWPGLNPGHSSCQMFTGREPAAALSPLHRRSSHSAPKLVLVGLHPLHPVTVGDGHAAPQLVQRGLRIQSASHQLRLQIVCMFFRIRQQGSCVADLHKLGGSLFRANVLPRRNWQYSSAVLPYQRPNPAFVGPVHL
jgi:hypothetical protein